MREVFITGAAVCTEAVEPGWLAAREARLMDRRTLCFLAALHRACSGARHSWPVASDDAALAVQVDGFHAAGPDWEEARQRGLAEDEENQTPAFLRNLPPLWLLPRLPNMVAGHAARLAQIKGPVWTSAWNVVSPLEPLQLAHDWVSGGETDLVFCGVARENPLEAAVLVIGSASSSAAPLASVHRAGETTEQGSFVELVRGLEQSTATPRRISV